MVRRKSRSKVRVPIKKVTDRDWVKRGISYIVRHAKKSASTPSYDVKNSELHDRAIRKLTRKICRDVNHLEKNNNKVKLGQLSLF